MEIIPGEIQIWHCSPCFYIILPFNLSALCKPRASSRVSAGSSLWLAGLAVYPQPLLPSHSGS